MTNDKTFDEIATAKKRIKKTTVNLSILQMFEGELMRCMFFPHIFTGKELPSQKVDKYNQPKTFVALYYPLLFCGKGYKVIDPHFFMRMKGTLCVYIAVLIWQPRNVPHSD